MIDIKPLEKHQIPDAKRVILTVARNTYQWKDALDEIGLKFDEQGEFADIDNFQSHYHDQSGLFLVVLDSNAVVGTGAIRQLDNAASELKRLWLLEKYQGKGIGFRLIQELIGFARKNGSTKILLETDVEQGRAVKFYHQVGFRFIEKFNDRNSDFYMELLI